MQDGQVIGATEAGGSSALPSGVVPPAMRPRNLPESPPVAVPPPGPTTPPRIATRRLHHRGVRLAGRSLRRLTSLAFGLALILTLLAALAYLRLRQGPVTLPGLDRMAEAEIEARLGIAEAQIGAVVFALGSGPDQPAGLRLRDVALRDDAGRLLFATPDLGMRFMVGDALRGDIAPTEIFLAGANLRASRDATGQFRLLLLDAMPPAVGPPETAPPAPAQTGEAAGLGNLLGMLQRSDLPVLRKLARVRLTGVALRYEDALSGRTWTADGATALLTRGPDGVRGRIDIAVTPAAAPAPAPTRLVIEAHQGLGADGLSLSARFDAARPADIADQIPALGWLRPLEAPVSGAFDLEIGGDGGLIYLTGGLRVGAGQLDLGPGQESLPITAGRLDVAYDGREGQFRISDLAVQGPSGKISATGRVMLDREGGTITGLVAALRLGTVEVSAPEVFADPLRFTEGRLDARVRLNPLRIDLGRLDLIDGGFRLGLGGSAGLDANGAWQLAFDARAAGLGTRRLAALWPLMAAPGARDWVDRNLPEGEITRLVAGFRQAGTAEPLFGLNFAFRDAVAVPVRGLPPITRASGIGSLNPDSFSVTVQSGEAVPEGRGVIDLSGSVFRIPDLMADPPIADVRLTGSGAIGDILALIDQPPLRLLSKIGAKPDLAAGQASLEARLGFPLINALTPGDVAASVTARLTEVSLAQPVAGLPVSADRLTLVTDGKVMTISGPARFGPAGIDLTWTETFGPAPGQPQSRMTADLDLTPDLLAALGAKGIAEALSGAAPAKLTATITGSDPPRFTLAGNLKPAALAIAGLGWSKPEGTEGSLEIAGTLGPRVALTKVALSGAGLTLDGAVELDEKGGLAKAEFPVFRLDDTLDTRLSLAPDPDRPGKLRARLTGGSLDLLALGQRTASTDDDGEESDFTADLALDDLILTPRIHLMPARGTLGPAKPGTPFLHLDGLANGGADTAMDLTRTEAGMTLLLTSPDAGRFLRDTGYFASGHDGSLRLDVRLPKGSDGMEGTVSLRDITVRDAPVLSRMLSVASITGVLETLSTGGLGFDRVEIPFSRRDGTLTLKDARATGPSIGLTLAGSYDEGADRLDLSGVFSPAYLLNGLLGEVPLIGTLLTGDKGEGVFGFSYSLRGSADDPDVIVNPLSILTPGALRGLFVAAMPRLDNAPARLEPGADVTPRAVRRNEKQDR